ncbi:filamentous hemagglutinin outer membrane protein [Calothrix sp. NIES-4071]|nr:filamentous hemagglutinin outer membrane protein [Calothrix sp. NIES-4071]BAZ54582.1 filamentous hemagglutinin outer membrane protein [Calothrix sp. NIES-4105]
MQSFKWVCYLSIISLILDIPARAQIVPDNSVGTLLAPNIDIQGLPSDVINGGTKSGSNLFHSFQEFNVGALRGVYFSNPTDVTNIFTRVTGSNPSNINGTLGVLGNANLFFLNPNGISFGSTAFLDVKGSFVGTTASSINFVDGTQFSAASTQSSLLTVSVPVGLGFGSNGGKINNRSTANGQGLQVQNNQSLLLVGGDVTVSGGRLEAKGGNVELGGIASSGTVGLSTSSGVMRLSFPEGVPRANVSLTNEGINPTMINVTDSNGGSIAITGNNIDINGSLLNGGVAVGFIGAQGGDISLNATGAINIASSSISNMLFPQSIGNSGDINITAGSLAVTNSSKLIASTSGQGNSGSVNINARGTVAFEGSGSTGFSTVVFSNVEQTSLGNSGGINVTADSVNLTSGARLNTVTSGQGSAGNININAHSTVALDGVSKNGAISTILSAVMPTGAGRAGDVNITTGWLSILDGGQIGAGSYGQGNPGSLNINARNDIIFDGVGNSTGATTGAFSLVGVPELQQEVVGNSGGINIDTNSLTLRNGAVIATSTFGLGDAGKVNINARESILFDGVGANGYPSGIGTTVERLGVGNGGDIEIVTKSLSLTNGAGLVASSRGQGNGGNITVNANTLTAANGGQIVTNSIGSGNAGNITLSVQKEMILSGNDVTYPERLANFGQQRVFTVGSESGIFANTSRNSQGQGGDLRIVTGKLTLSDGAIANVSSEGTGNAGNFKVRADSILLNNFSSFKAENREGSGGNIILDASNITLRQNSNITTNASDTATGGNININADTLVALENSDITANAKKGRGGNINITTQGIFRDSESDITATSDVGINGSVNITKPDTNQQNNLIEQSSNFGNTEMAIATSCQVNRNVASSKFVVTGNGGLPDTPSRSDIQYEVAQVRAVGLNNNIQSAYKNSSNSNGSWKLGDLIQEASQLIVSKDGRLLLKAINNGAVESSQNLTCHRDVLP